MKKLQCKTEGIWKETLQIALTPEEENILKISGSDLTPEIIATKKALIADLQIRSIAEPTAEDILSAQTAYEFNKPTVNEGDVYELVSADISLPNQNGVIIYKINNHTEVIGF